MKNMFRLLVPALLAAGAVDAATRTNVYTTPGGPYAFTVPLSTTSITVQAVGGGGAGYAIDLPYSRGADVRATIPVAPGTNLFVYVGGNGGNLAFQNGSGPPAPGGVNGGGNAGGGAYGAGGGGGASDIRSITNNLSSRLIVAGGGGGGNTTYAGAAAGTAGEASPCCSRPAAQPGGSASGGTGAAANTMGATAGSAGTFGVGGNGGGDSVANAWGGGGGGGWYGGGGGAAYASGAGGSSYVTSSATGVSIGLVPAVSYPTRPQPKVVIVYDLLPPTNVTATVSPSTLTTSGSLTAVVTARVTDASANGVPGEQVVFTNAPGTLSIGAVTDNGDGNYRATITAPSMAGTYVVTARVASVSPNLIATATLTVTVDSNLVVSTTNDVVAGDGLTSLREAVSYASALSGTQTITFAAALAGQTVVLTNGWTNSTDASALRVTNSIVIQGLTNSPGITIAVGAGLVKRHLRVGGTGRLTLDRLTFTGGHAPDRGGVVENTDAGSLTVRNCTMTGNTSDQEGGALHAWAGSTLLAVDNSTFVGNSASNQGAAIVSGATQTTLRHLTVVSNTCPAGPVWIYQVAATLLNSIVAGNNPDGISIFGTGTFAGSSSNNILGTGNAAGLTNGIGGNFVGVPGSAVKIGALANNGGPAPTMAPLAESPVINAGVVIGGVTNDQRGFARNVGGAPDMGAVEDATGNSDADGDNISNVGELMLGSNPANIDTDADGYNDATEMLNATSPTNAASIPPATRIERVLGYGPARGLDLTGNFTYSFNVGTPGAAGQAGDAFFFADNSPGITITAPNQIPTWNTPAFGATAADDVLEFVYQSIRWSGAPVTVDLANLVVGRLYKLQLLFGEQCCTNRTFDVFAGGVQVANDFRPGVAQGSIPVTKAASAIVHEFFATNATLRINLNGASVPVGSDTNSILNGVTLEQLTVSGIPAVLDNFTLNGASLGSSFTNLAASSFTVYGATNVETPLNLWSNLGPATESPPTSGLYQFSMPAGTNTPQFFLRVQSP